ncbi:hypothetical protein EV560_10360 [Bosea sp. BK604]|nr:hypothetical protein EV560_10360 [Bosea sp. BK604]
MTAPPGRPNARGGLAEFSGPPKSAAAAAGMYMYGQLRLLRWPIHAISEHFSAVLATG